MHNNIDEINIRVKNLEKLQKEKKTRTSKNSNNGLYLSKKF